MGGQNVTSSNSKLTRGALAKAADVNLETVRYFEKIGLMPSPERSKKGYRVYGRADQQRLIFIRRAKTLGFATPEVKNLLAMVDGQVHCGEVQDMARTNIDAINDKIADLTKIRTALSHMANACTGNNAPECPIIDQLMES